MYVKVGRNSSVAFDEHAVDEIILSIRPLQDRDSACCASDATPSCDIGLR